MSIAEKLQTIVENEQKVYEVGKKAGRKEFWDEYQERGNRTDYTNAFQQKWWNKNNFKPVHDIIPTTCTHMFSNFNNGELNEPLDMVEVLNEQGIVFNTTFCVGFVGFLSNAKISRMPVITISNGDNNGVFASPHLKKIEGIRHTPNNNNGILVKLQANTFTNATSLEEVYFMSPIRSGVYLQMAPLIPKCAAHICETIMDVMGTSYEYSYYVKFSDAVWDNLNATISPPEGFENWQDYVMRKGWNI